MREPFVWNWLKVVEVWHHFFLVEFSTFTITFSASGKERKQIRFKLNLMSFDIIKTIDDSHEQTKWNNTFDFIARYFCMESIENCVCFLLLKINKFHNWSLSFSSSSSLLFDWISTFEARAHICDKTILKKKIFSLIHRREMWARFETSDNLLWKWN